MLKLILLLKTKNKLKGINKAAISVSLWAEVPTRKQKERCLESPWQCPDHGWKEAQENFGVRAADDATEKLREPSPPRAGAARARVGGMRGPRALRLKGPRPPVSRHPPFGKGTMKSSGG